MAPHLAPHSWNRAQEGRCSRNWRSLEPDLLAETADAMIGASIRLLPDEPPSQNGDGV